MVGVGCPCETCRWKNTWLAIRGGAECELKRLKEEGIELPRDKRNLLFGLFGIPALTMMPLYFLNRRRDLLADKLSALPAAYYYTVGAAVTAGFIVCHALPGGGDRVRLETAKFERASLEVQALQRQLQEKDQKIDELKALRIPTPSLFPVDVHVNQSGTDACDSQGMICVSMSRFAVADKNDKFFGYTTPTCSAKLIRDSFCRQDHETDYALKGIVVRRSPEADEGVLDLSGTNTVCMRGEKGKQGIYQFANCVKP